MSKRIFKIGDFTSFPKLADCPKSVTGEHDWYKQPTKYKTVKHWYNLFISDYIFTHFVWVCSRCKLVDDRKEYRL